MSNENQMSDEELRARAAEDPPWFPPDPNISMDSYKLIGEVEFYG